MVNRGLREVGWCWGGGWLEGDPNCFPSEINLFSLEEPCPIASDFFQTFLDFGIRRKHIFFSVPLVNFTAGKCINCLEDINENVTCYGYHK